MVLAIEEFISKSWKGKVVKILFSEKMIRDFLESHHFVKFGIKEKSLVNIKFVKYIIFLI